MCKLLYWNKLTLHCVVSIIIDILLNLFIFRLLDKLGVICPHSDSCKEVSQRGILEDHLRYRCEGTLVACQYAGLGAPSGAPTRRCGITRTTASTRKKVGGHFLVLLQP